MKPLSLVFFLVALAAPLSAAKLRALIIDGQNNHDVWPKSTMMMMTYLEQTGRFDVYIQRTAFTWNSAKWLSTYPLDSQPETKEWKMAQTDPHFAPEFSAYDVVVSNFGWQTAPWPRATRTAFETYMKNGGGFVVVHAANNPFPAWPAYNRIIGLGAGAVAIEPTGPTSTSMTQVNKSGTVRPFAPAATVPSTNSLSHTAQSTRSRPDFPRSGCTPWMSATIACGGPPKTSPSSPPPTPRPLKMGPAVTSPCS
ncbi:MAG: ThuA domain-containing protein [Candidatus Synoicihabitans palmerolidicus]|nr:ThuA domain-containing protein [Candidatus Synoicihabitans palmerolidicus]